MDGWLDGGRKAELISFGFISCLIAYGQNYEAYNQARKKARQSKIRLGLAKDVPD